LDSLEYEARSAHAAEQTVLIADYQGRTLFWQTFATIGAFVAAAFAAFYARNAVYEAKRVGQAQVRAYLSCVSGQFSIESGWIAATVHLKNFGQSPAINVQSSASLHWMNAVTTEQNPIPYIENHRTFVCDAKLATIPSGNTEETFLHWEKSKLPNGLFDQLVGGDRQVSIAGTLRWQDVFGEEQSTDFWLFEERDGLLDRALAIIGRKGKLRVSANPAPTNKQ
jgi:hypothetical protein